MAKHPAQQKWWKVTRRYTVEDQVFVEAESATEARVKAQDGEYDEVLPAEVVSDTTFRKAERIAGGKPKELWETADWEAVENDDPPGF